MSSGQINPGPILQPGEPRYEQLAAALSTGDPAKLEAIIHPFARMLPMIPENARATFRTSLAAGQNHAVIFAKGMLLDGRNRTRELTQLRKPISTGTFIGTDRDALELVKAENIERRHLSESQRADFAARVSMLPVGANQHTSKPAPIGAPSLAFGDDPASDPTPPEPLISQGEAAEMFNVSRRSVQRATVYQKDGIPEISEAVQAGEMSASAAAEIARLPIEEQRAIIAAADPKVVKDIAKKNRTEKQTKGRERRLKNMTSGDATPLLDGGGKVGLFYVDVPREFISWSEESGAEKSPENHYRTEGFQFLADMREKILARAEPNAVMFMYAWANSLQDQLDLLAEWGFASVRRRDEAGLLLRDEVGRIHPPVGEGRYRSHQIWAKRSSNGNLHQGMGFWFRDCHELLLVGARGDVPAPLQGTQALSVIDALIGAHSEKPNELFRDQIDRYFPGVRKLEMFGRVDDPEVFKARWPEWEVWGNHRPQATTTAEAAE